MNYKLSRKNKDGKWWTYGGIKKNQWDNLQASFKLSSLKELVELAEGEGKEWVNLSMFEDEAKGEAPRATPSDNYHTPDLQDEIPF